MQDYSKLLVQNTHAKNSNEKPSGVIGEEILHRKNNDKEEIVRCLEEDEITVEDTVDDTAGDTVGDTIRDCGEGENRISLSFPRLDFIAVRNLVNGHAYARYRKWDLNVMITIRLDRSATFDPADWTGWQGRLLDKVTRWLHRHDIPPAFLWTKEAGRWNGEHLHLLVHLTDPLRQCAALEDFVRRTSNFLPDTTGNRAVVASYGKFGMQTIGMQAGALKYLLKSIPPAEMHNGVNLARYLQIEPRRNLQAITGRPHHIAQSIGPAARAAAGWRELRDLAQLYVFLNPEDQLPMPWR